MTTTQERNLRAALARRGKGRSAQDTVINAMKAGAGLTVALACIGLTGLPPGEVRGMLEDAHEFVDDVIGGVSDFVDDLWGGW